jgi:hypothetical protein
MNPAPVMMAVQGATPDNSELHLIKSVQLYRENTLEARAYLPYTRWVFHLWTANALAMTVYIT